MGARVARIAPVRAVGAYLRSIELDSEALSSALPTTDKTADSNDDMMILVVDDPDQSPLAGRSIGDRGISA